MAKAETGEQYVTIRLPRERKDQPDVWVAINERTWLIKRGVDVDVPYCVARALEDREKALETIYMFDEQNAQ